MAQGPRKPWPVEAYRDYQEVVRLRANIEALITTTIEEGTEARNKFVVAALWGPIAKRTREMKDHCQAICSLLGENRGRGRFPKWFTVTMDIQARIMSILELVDEVEPALKGNELIYLKSVFKCLKVEIERINKLLKEHPYRADISGLEIWNEVAEKVNEAFKK